MLSIALVVNSITSYAQDAIPTSIKCFTKKISTATATPASRALYRVIAEQVLISIMFSMSSKSLGLLKM